MFCTSGSRGGLRGTNGKKFRWLNPEDMGFNVLYSRGSCIETPGILSDRQVTLSATNKSFPLPPMTQRVIQKKSSRLVTQDLAHSASGDVLFGCLIASFDFRGWLLEKAIVLHGDKIVE